MGDCRGKLFCKMRNHYIIALYVRDVTENLLRIFMLLNQYLEMMKYVRTE